MACRTPSGRTGSAHPRDREPGLRYNASRGEADTRKADAKGCTMAPDSGRGDGTGVPVRASRGATSACRSWCRCSTRRPGSPRCMGASSRSRARLKAERGLPREVVYVDDGSRDNTLAIARGLPADRARRPGGLAVAQFRQGGGAARRPRSCPARRACCSWTATASIRRR